MYLRLSEGLNKYKLIPENQNIYDLITSYDKDYYLSLYKYNEEHYKQWKKTKSVAGIKDVITDKIVLDFDNEANIEQARLDTITALERIKALGVPEESIQLSWSGKKGFGIEFQINKNITHEEFKQAVFKLGGDLSTFDTVVNDPQRIVRVTGTKHQSSGLYKYPLTANQLKTLSVEDIKTLSKTNEVDDSLFENNKFGLKNSLPDDYFIVPKTETKEPSLTDAMDIKLDMSKKPRWLSEAKYALQEGFFPTGEGKRHTAFMILASTYKNQGFNRTMVYRMLKGVAEKQAERTNTERFPDDELWNSITKSVFDPAWEGGQYPKDHPLLVETAKKLGLKIEADDDKPILFNDLGGDAFTRYAKSYFETRIYTGLDDLDKAFPMCAGSNVAIVGAASSGKTALSLNILKKMKETNAVSVFASLDMARSRLYEKLLYSVTNGEKTREEIYHDYINGNGYKYDAAVKEQFPNTFIYSKSAPNVEDLKNYILKVQDFTGKPVRLLMIDYFERLGSDKSDDTAASKDVAAGIQDLIADFPELTPITLYQPNKFSMGGGPDKPITNYTAIKGSSFIIQSARQILSLWRPFFNPEYKDYDKFMEMAILKNDLGELDKFCYNWEGRTGKISLMDSEQEMEYEEYMAIKNQAEKANKEEF